MLFKSINLHITYEKYLNLINSLYKSRSSLKDLRLELDSDLKIGVKLHVLGMPRVIWIVHPEDLELLFRSIRKHWNARAKNQKFPAELLLAKTYSHIFWIFPGGDRISKEHIL